MHQRQHYLSSPKKLKEVKNRLAITIIFVGLKISISELLVWFIWYNRFKRGGKMHIQCTKAMLDYIKPNLTELNTDNDMYAWHAHLVKRSRKNLLVIMHDLSRFTLIFYGVKKSHLKELYQIISIAMMNSMIGVGFTPEQVKAYIDSQPDELTFNHTKNRTLVARLNKAVETTDHILSTEGYYDDNIEQVHASIFCNQLMVCEDNYKVCYDPKDKLKEYLDLFLKN